MKICDRTLMLPGSTTTDDNRIFKATVTSARPALPYTMFSFCNTTRPRSCFGLPTRRQETPLSAHHLRPDHRCYLRPALSPLADCSGCGHARPDFAVAWLSDQAIVAPCDAATRAVAAGAAER